MNVRVVMSRDKAEWRLKPCLLFAMARPVFNGMMSNDKAASFIQRVNRGQSTFPTWKTYSDPVSDPVSTSTPFLLTIIQAETASRLGSIQVFKGGPMLSPLLTVVSVASGFASAGAWFYASRVRVTREKALDERREAAEKNGTVPDLSGVTFDGWEVRETLAAQAKWNSVGAVLAAVAISSQAAALAISHI